MTLLDYPVVYQTFQNAGGWFGARLKAIDAYLKLDGNERILDIGCGPGFITKHLPEGVNYIGFDPNEKYINYAQRNLSKYGKFMHGYFDVRAAGQIGKVQIVMLNGVLHHMNDDEAAEVTQLAYDILEPGGRLFTLDGCRVEGQSALIRALINADRGKFVRTEVGYRQIIERHFDLLHVSIDDKFSWMPYTFITMVATKVQD